jgi:hypothetical protein
MPCDVPKAEREEYVQLLVLEYFKTLVSATYPLSLETSLGKWGLNHSMVQRKLYYDAIADRLAQKGCVMKTLKPSDFADASKRKWVRDIADMVLKDLA